MASTGSHAPRIAVVGSGISGMSAALELERRGCSVEIIERADRLGGRFGIDRLGDRPVMTGGKNIGTKYSAFRGVIGALGQYAWEPFGINTSRVVDGKVRVLDSNKLLASLRHTFEIGAPADLAKLAAYAVRIQADRANAFLDSPFFGRKGRDGDGKPLSGHFGPKLTRNLLRPMTIRMNGAEPDEVYVGTFGTNLSLMLDTYEQLTDGVQPVLDEFARRFPVGTEATVRALIVTGGRVTGLRVERGGALREEPYDGVVLATPAYAAADIVASADPGLAELLRRVRYFPSTVALVEYDRPFFPAEVRALVLDGGPCTNVGAYGADDRHIVRYTFSGRQARRAPDQDTLTGWIDAAEREVAGYLDIVPGTRVTAITHHWPAAYCAYGPQYAELLTDLHRHRTALPGLGLCGDYLLGVNLEACARSGVAAGAAIAAELAAIPA
ncbi:protoporphyrinogen/coproporphyrinogen oxidase [Nocardia harenae]|uniref:protoporphyrinogen/coproporphyrinogen oxidase n=1 Tax=Nocardia harenae TaxID=358707 RepID=UPI00082C6007|nr:FAD-dependent oxidoreductase [Nocardia harenae]